MEVENTDNIFLLVYGEVVIVISAIIVLHSPVALSIFKASQRKRALFELKRNFKIALTIRV